MTAEAVAPAHATFTLKCGRTITLRELNLLDLKDLEAFQKREGDGGFGFIGFILWLMVRKEGVSRQDQIAGKWAVKIEEILIDITAEDLVALNEAVRPFLPQPEPATQSGSSGGPSKVG